MLRVCQYSQLQHYKTLSSLLLLVTYEVAEDYASQVVRAGFSSDLAAQASRICHRTNHLPSVQSVHEEWRVSGTAQASPRTATTQKNPAWIWTTSALIVPSPISPTFQSSSNVLSLAAYLITCPLSTSYQTNSQLTGLSTPQKLPYCPPTTTLSVPLTVAKCHCLYY